MHEAQPRRRKGIVMHMYRPIAALLTLLLATALSACGNKGNLVKPTPAVTPPEQKTDTSQTPAATDAEPKPAQDSGGH